MRVENTKRWPRKNNFGKLLLSAFLTLGCVAPAIILPTPTTVPTPTTTSTQTTVPASRTPTSSATMAPTPTITPSPSATPIPTAMLPIKPLRQAGPWLLFWGQAGLYAMNPDGTGQTLVYKLDPKTYRRTSSVSPTGGHFAFIEGDPNPVLVVVSLPDGNVLKKIVVTNPNVSQVDAPDVGDSDWSPDGKQLAFISAVNGISADLFLFSTTTNEITRLTDAPTQSAVPIWSPDGKYIFNIGVLTFGTGAGWNVESNWVTDTKGESKHLSTQGDSAFWISSHELITYESMCNGNYQYINVDTGETKVIIEPGVCLIGFSRNPFDGNYIASLHQDFQTKTRTYTAGTYLIRASTWRRISDKSGGVTWSSRAGLYFVKTDPYDLQNHEVIAFHENGTPADLPFNITGFPTISEDESTWAWSDDQGIYVGLPTGRMKKVFDRTANIVWQADSNNLILCTLFDGIYVVNSPDYVPALVSTASCDTDLLDLVHP